MKASSCSEAIADAIYGVADWVIDLLVKLHLLEYVAVVDARKES